MKTHTLFFILIIELLILATPFNVDGEHFVEGEHHVEYPLEKYFDQRHEIHIVTVWIELEGEQCPPDCHIYPLRLISEMPPRCNMNAIGCVLDTGIYIINGKQGSYPTHNGCSLLWHEIAHIKHTKDYPDPEDAHDFFAEKYPNEKCAVKPLS